MNKYKYFFLPLAFTTIAFCCVLLTSRCTIKTPVTPSWDVTFTVPLVEKKYTMTDLAEDSKNVNIENNEVVFTFEEKIDPFQVGDNLRSGGAVVNKTVTFGTTSDGAALPDTIVVTKAVIKKGSVRVEINNSHGYGIQARFVMRDLRFNDGQPFAVNFYVQPNSRFVSDQIRLDGCQFNTTPSGGRNYVYYDAELSGGPVGDLVDIRLEISDFIYSSLTGRLKVIDVAFNEVNADIDLPDIIRGFKIGSASADLTIFNGIRFPALLDMSIRGMNEDGESASLSIPTMNVASAPSQGNPSTTIANIRNMEKIVNLFPSRIDFSGHARLGDNITQAGITEWDELSGKILFKAPMIFTLPDTVIETDVDTLKIEKDARDQFKNIHYASLVTQVGNHLPLGFTLSVFFSNSIGDKGIYQNPSSLKKDMVINPAPVSGSPGVVTQEAGSTFNLSLNKEEWKVFQDSVVYQGIRIVFPGTSKQMVRIRPTDYIYAKTRAEASIRTDFEKKDDEKSNEKGGGK